MIPRTVSGKKVLGVAILLLALFQPGTGVAADSQAGTPATVPWVQLPYYLATRGIPLNRKLPLCDCPLGINPKSPSHHLLQVIANTLYEWREYKFADRSGQPRLALIMTRPRARPLSAEEAGILLTASTLWQSPVPAGGQTAGRTAGPEITCRIPAGDCDPSPSRSGELANQEIIPPVQLEEFPCNTVACLEIMDLGKSYRGTGFQVSPYCYLTAGHNVFWKDHWVDNITVVPAQYTGSDGSTTIKPYGEQLCTRQNLRSNDKFLQESSYINISEFDYGAILLAQPFAGIKTFMPLEFHSPGQPLPDQVEIAGYPLYPYSNNRTSYNLWQAAGMVYNSPGGTYQQFIEFTAPVYGGNSGSPICYRNFLGQVRVVGITTWRYLDSAGGGGTLLTSQNEDLIRDWLAYTPTPDFKYTGYIPYFCSRDGCWTGLALANPNPDRCQAKVEYFAADGAPVGSQLLEIAAGGQAAFACSPNQNPYCTTGWIKISSTRPLSGLGLVGQNTPSTMFDMDLNTSLHQKLLFPHLAAEGEWRSTIILCNPNRKSAGSLEFTCLQPDGTAVTKQSSVPAGGSLVLDLEELFRQPLNGGQLILAASRPIAAFLLYDNTGGATGSQNRLWRAGLSATPFE